MISPIFLAIGFLGCNHQDNEPAVRSAWQDSIELGLAKDASYPDVKYVNETWHNQLNRLNLNRFNHQTLTPPVFEEDVYIEACKAISKKDLEVLKKLLSQIEDLDRVSSDGMTLLYWAFHVDDDPRPFSMLLDHGANPNVVLSTVRSGMPLQYLNGASVTYLVASSEYNRLFKKVFESGGDPNIEWSPKRARGLKFTPFLVLDSRCPDAIERFQVLIDAGAEINSGFDDHANFAVYQLRPFQQPERFELGCRLALASLKAGVDFNGPFNWTYYESDKRRAFEDKPFRLIHFLAEAKTTLFEGEDLQESRPNFIAAVDWLESNGESMEFALRDVKKWTAASENQSNSEKLKD